MHGTDAETLRNAGAEYGAKTGRPRRVGPLDLVATRYGAAMQNATGIAVTKLDILGYMDSIPVCTKYIVNGKETDKFPFPAALDKAEPVIEWMPGWKTDVSGVRSWDDLPKEAQDYINMIERVVGIPVKYISVGAERDSIIIR
jgi:adenylosuccinate synthase